MFLFVFVLIRVLSFVFFFVWVSRHMLFFSYWIAGHSGDVHFFNDGVRDHESPAPTLILV
jgi:hypothetical protein